MRLTRKGNMTAGHSSLAGQFPTPPIQIKQNQKKEKKKENEPVRISNPVPPEAKKGAKGTQSRSSRIELSSKETTGTPVFLDVNAYLYRPCALFISHSSRKLMVFISYIFLIDVLRVFVKRGKCCDRAAVDGRRSTTPHGERPSR